MSTRSIPLSLIRYQGPMLRAWSRAFARSWLPFVRPSQNPAEFEDLAAIHCPLPIELVRAYITWSGGQEEGVLPPHMFAQWGLPLALQVIEQSKYDLVDIINQGVHMRCNGPLPLDAPLVVRASLRSMREEQGRADLDVRIVTGTKQRHDLVEATLHTTFLSPAARRAVLRSARVQVESWQTLGVWHAEPDDGFQFALLTGDFNPIHWIDAIGRKSAFGRTVLQGLGLFARTYECLQESMAVYELDLRFLRPIPLPSGSLQVQVSPEVDVVDGYHLRVVDAEGRVRAAGRVQAQTPL